MSRLEELEQEFDDKYGVGWDRSQHLTEGEEVEWIEACYDYYENECEQKDVYGGPYSDISEEWYGKPFEIVERVSPYDREWDMTSLPIWIIRIDSELDNDPGEFAAYPEELFIDPRDN